MTVPTLTFDDALLDLRARCAGAVLTPADDGYDTAKSGFNVRFDQRPALVVDSRVGRRRRRRVRFAAALGLGSPSRPPATAWRARPTARADRDDPDDRTSSVDPGPRDGVDRGRRQWGRRARRRRRSTASPRSLGSTHRRRRGRLHARRRLGWLGPPLRALAPTACARSSLVTPDGRAGPRLAPTHKPSCSGRCVAGAGAGSASSPRWRSSCTR